MLFQIQLIDAVDQEMFRETNWTGSDVPFGLSIKKVQLCGYLSYSKYACSPVSVLQLLKCLQIVVHREATEAGREPIYNRVSPEGGWNSNTLLTHFSHANRSDVCLSHLFTAEVFRDGRLGVAYIASPTEGLTGGICSESE